MCLIIAKKTETERDGLIVKSRKIIKKHGTHKVTPYQNFQIPSDGWLFPERQSRKQKYKYGDLVHGGFIHALKEEPKSAEAGSWTSTSRKKVVAYSFAVEAYGRSNDLICRAIFIPSAVVGKGSRATINKIRKLMAYDKLTREIILYEFPHLEKAFKNYRKGQ